MRRKTGSWIVPALAVFTAGCDSVNRMEPGFQRTDTSATASICRDSERIDGIPPLTIHHAKLINGFVRTEFLEQSEVIGEEILAGRTDESAQIVSLTLLPAMTIQTIAVRVEGTGSKITLSARKALKQDGNDLAVPPVEPHTDLMPEDWLKPQDKPADADFWNLPTPEDRIGFDDAHWIVEAVACGCLHIVNRWSPNPDSEYGRLTAYMLELADRR